LIAGASDKIRAARAAELPQTHAALDHRLQQSGPPCQADVVASTLEVKAWRFGVHDFRLNYRGFAGMIVDVTHRHQRHVTGAGRIGTASAKALIPALGGIARVFRVQSVDHRRADRLQVPGRLDQDRERHYADMDIYAMLTELRGLVRHLRGYRKFDVGLRNDATAFQADGTAFRFQVLK
jgi:hypothetical protein